MKKPKFILKKDWYLETNVLGVKNKTLIFPKGHEFTANESDDKYHIAYGGWSEQTPNIGGRMIVDEEEMRLANDNGELLYDEVKEKEDLNLIIEEVPEDDDIQVKRWRIQLDVTTTRKKLKEIEKIVNEKVKEIL